MVLIDIAMVYEDDFWALAYAQLIEQLSKVTASGISPFRNMPFFA